MHMSQTQPLNGGYGCASSMRHVLTDLQNGGPAARLNDAEAPAETAAVAAAEPVERERAPKPAGPAGGVYIPPFKLAQMMRDADDKEGKVQPLYCRAPVAPLLLNAAASVSAAVRFVLGMNLIRAVAVLVQYVNVAADCCAWSACLPGVVSRGC